MVKYMNVALFENKIKFHPYCRFNICSQKRDVFIMTGTWSGWELVVPCTPSCGEGEELWIRACLTGTNCEGKMTEKRVACVERECDTAGSRSL